MTSTASTFASLMLAVMVIGVAATADSQDRAPAPVVEGQDQKPSTPLESQENTAALPESQEKTPGPTAPSPDKAPEPGGKQDQKSVVASEVVVYASDLSERALFELDFCPSGGSPGGHVVGVHHRGAERHPQRAEGPHVTYKVRVL